MRTNLIKAVNWMTSIYISAIMVPISLLAAVMFSWFDYGVMSLIYLYLVVFVILLAVACNNSTGGGALAFRRLANILTYGLATHIILTVAFIFYIFIAKPSGARILMIGVVFSPIFLLLGQCILLRKTPLLFKSP